MPNFIEVRHLDNHEQWSKWNLSQQEIDEVKEYCDTDRENRPWLAALIFPVRTNSLKNFAKDLLLPTTINIISTINNVAVKIFAGMLAFGLDIITVPIRLITSVPRALYNARLPEHPLAKYLKDHRVNERLLSSDVVRVKLGWEEVTEIERPSHHTVRREQVWREFNVTFIEVPSYKWYANSYFNHGRSCLSEQTQRFPQEVRAQRRAVLFGTAT